MAEGVKYIKIAKIDGDGTDQTFTLQSLTELTIPYSTGNITYKILSISEQPNYFLYSVDNLNIEHADRALLDYDFTGSANTNATSVQYAGKLSSEISITSVSDPLLFSATSSANSTTNIVKLNTYPQKDIFLSVTGSLVVTNNSTAGVYDPIISITEHQSNGTINELVTQDLSNVGPGGVTTTYNFHLTHTIPSGSTPGTEFGFQLLSKQAVASVTGSFQFSDTQVFLTSSVASGPAVETIPEPFFTQNFNRSLDCQPTLNNIIINRRSYQYQDIDYTSGMFIPTNFDLLINDTALKAQVQDSNYTTKRHIRPRYEGSKNTTDDVNSSAITQSTYLQILHPNDDLGTSTLNQPSVSSLDSTIYEFRFGGGTYPEISTGGAVLVDQMLNVDNKDSVNITTPISDDFRDIMERKFPIHSKPFITQYTTISSNVVDAKVIGVNVGVPSISNYIAGSSDPSTQVAPTSLNQIAITTTIKEVSTNSSGQYITSSTSPVLTSTEIISSSLNNGHRWYITIYDSLPIPIQGTLEPFNSGSSNSYYITDINDNYPEPLAKNGVYEITNHVSSNEFSISPDLPETGWTCGSGDKGCLIWRSSGGEDVTFDGATLSGVGKGNLITVNSTEVIKENLTYITKTYGTNP